MIPVFPFIVNCADDLHKKQGYISANILILPVLLVCGKLGGNGNEKGRKGNR